MTSAAQDTDDDEKPYQAWHVANPLLPSMFKSQGDAIMTRPARVGKAGTAAPPASPSRTFDVAPKRCEP